MAIGEVDWEKVRQNYWERR